MRNLVHPTMIEFMQNELFDRSKLVLPCDVIPFLFFHNSKDCHGTVTQAVDGDVYDMLFCQKVYLAIEPSIQHPVYQMNLYIVIKPNNRSTSVFHGPFTT